MIKLESISKTYNLGNEKVHALNNINLNIEEGDFISIIGPSGSGKSTLMNIIGLLDNNYKGKYILDNKDISKQSDDELSIIRSKNIGFVFQHFNLLPKLTAIENVMVPLLYQGYTETEAYNKSKEALKKVNLSHRLNHLPNELSGGQMQRVAIARAIVSKLKLILADEPTGAVDTKTGEEIIKIFKELNHGGQTILLITHDLSIASNAKKTIKIQDGELYENK